MSRIFEDGDEVGSGKSSNQAIKRVVYPLWSMICIAVIPFVFAYAVSLRSVSELV